VFAPFDGDVVFALATGGKALPDARAAAIARIGANAADCLARAIARGVYEAEPWEDAPVATYRTSRT
jgi:L-aminopeptidase/D-esterase-like protein